MPSLNRFQSTLPVRGATNVDSPNYTLYIISIHAPREGSDPLVQGFDDPLPISIHAPREGSDDSDACPETGCTNFNPRSP